MGLTIRQATLADAASVSAFVLAHPLGGFEHDLRRHLALAGTPELGEAQRAVGARVTCDVCYFLAVGDGGEIRGVLPGQVWRAALAGCSGFTATTEFAAQALLASDDEAGAALLDGVLAFASAERLDFVGLSLDDGPLRGRLPGKPLVSPHFVQNIALPRTEDAYLLGLPSRLRTRLRAAERGGLRVTWAPLDAETLATFLESYRDVVARADQRGETRLQLPDPAGLAQLPALLPPSGAVEVGVVERAGQRLGAQVCIQVGRTATFFRGGPTAQGLAEDAGALLMLGAVRWALARGCERLELGETTPQGGGLYRFKQMFGAAHRATDRVLLALGEVSSFEAVDLWTSHILEATFTGPWDRRLRQLAEYLSGPVVPLAGRRFTFLGRVPGVAELERVRALGATARIAEVAAPAVAVEEVIALDAGGELRLVDALSLATPVARARALRCHPPERLEALATQVESHAAVVWVADDAEQLERAARLMRDDDGALRSPAAARGALLALSDECRFSGARCPAARLDQPFIGAGGTVHPCRRGPEVGRLAEPEETWRRLAPGERPECATCVASPWCSRCPVELSGPNPDAFCAQTRSRVMHDTVSLLRGARAIFATLGPPAAEHPIALPAVLPVTDAADASEAERLPPVVAGVEVTRVADTFFAVRPDRAAPQQIGETIADVFGLARRRATRSAATHALESTYGISTDEAAAALTEALAQLAQAGLLAADD